MRFFIARSRKGLNCGWMRALRRAHKHTDHPDEATIKDQILQGILNGVREYFEFGNLGGGHRGR